MPLTVLTDSDVRDVLDGLERQDILDLHKTLGDALHNYSTALEPEDSGCCAANQPRRIAVKRQDGTTLFMPATADDAFGVKTVTLSDDSGAPSLHGSESSKDSFPSSPSLSKASTASTSTDVSRKTSTVSSMSSVSNAPTRTPSTVPILTASDPVTAGVPSAASPRGTLTLFNLDGTPRALINASTLTAFRTALASTILLKLRRNVHTFTVFGAGMQAYWHIFCALLLRGDEIHHLHLINRDFERAQKLYIQLAQHPSPVINEVWLDGKIKPTILTPRHGEYSRLLKEHVRASDVIFCCTPSTTPLFPAGYLTHTEGRKKARYIAAIGSYKPHMHELPEEVLRQAVATPEDSHRGGIHLHHRHANEGGAIVVDTIEGALSEAGEIIKAGISGRGVVELGELVMLKRSHWAEKAQKEQEERERKEKAGQEKHHGGGHGIGHLFHHHKKEAVQDPHAHDGGLKDWLARGNVIYKSVGLGLMDVVVGMEIVKLAEQRGIGTTIECF